MLITLFHKNILRLNKHVMQGRMQVKYKVEISLLLLSIALYLLSLFCYFYEAPWEGMIPVTNYPYQKFALPLAGAASALLIIAAILYLKRKRK
jgi:LPXTG-motif cell wall-anchored protein